MEAKKEIPEYLKSIGKPRKRKYEPAEISEEYLERLRLYNVPQQSTIKDALKRLRSILSDLVDDYQVTDEIRNAVYVFMDEALKDSPRGLIVQGNFGSGKTVLFEGLSKWSGLYDNIRTFKVISAHDLISYYEGTEGDEYLRGLQGRSICIDDLGAEKISQRYGREELMIRFLEMRYNVRKRVSTHILTNLTNAELLDRYGPRVESRLSEMCLRLKIGASKDAIDFRKQ